MNRHPGALMGCVANNSRPLRVCTNCVQYANDVTKTHERLKNVTNHIFGTKKCIDALTHKDVLEVVEDVFAAAVGEKRWVQVCRDGKLRLQVNLMAQFCVK